ncbi:BppU family phage baseplate upper protein [Clostridium perfringens]|nr:BppU family phage baseplate upper protein [Clostridium perfringens]
MSEIGLNINVDSYNNEGIKTIKGNNNAEIYKLYILKNKRRLSLVGKTVKLGYVMAGTTNGDVIENLNITNAEQGEITFPITNRISKQDGVYSCQLAIYGADGFLEHTATFGLTVEANIFTKIAGEIADSKDFTYLENILDKASKLSEKLKENTATATNANSNLESNITEANNINSKLLENTSTATSLNKNLESNIDLAKEVKETIKDLDTKNTEATEKIGELTNLNNKAEELSNNINQALPINAELIKNTESAKVANTNLAAANQEAISKNTELQASLEKTKEFIDGLDGSQNIPQLRLDVTELQNGLKSNQALNYEGSSIVANDTLEGRTEGMRIGGRTLVNLEPSKNIAMNIGSWNTFTNGSVSMYKPNTKYTVIVIVEDNKLNGEVQFIGDDNNVQTVFKTGINLKIASGSTGVFSKTYTTKDDLSNCVRVGYWVHNPNSITGTLRYSMLILEGDWTNKEIPGYFQGIKSFGESEQEGDKYKISILSEGKNINSSIFEIGEINSTGVTVDAKSIARSKEYIKCNIRTCTVTLNESSQFIVRNIVCYNANKQFIGYCTNSRELPSETCYIKITIRKSDSSVIEENDLKTIQCQIEEGTQSTSYEPYKCDKKDILIKEPLRESDIMYEDNGQVKVYRPTKQYTFTGNETSIVKWVTVTDESFIGFCITNDDIPNLTSNRSLVVCNNFPSTDGVFNKRNMYIAGNRANICIEKSALATPDIEGFRAWLKANPTTIVYQLATPTVEIVENCVDIDLDTFGEKTYFNILNSLPGTLDFKVPSNLGSVVQNMAKEVNNIWDVINNLLVPGILDVNKKVALATIKNNLK